MNDIVKRLRDGDRGYSSEAPIGIITLMDDAADEIERLRQERDDYKEAYEDTKRLTRLLDVALVGEENAAQQASLCDLIGEA